MEKITVENTINAPVEKVWTAYTDPELVKKWNAASPDWHSPKAENDLRVGGEFNYRMEAKDGSEGFDFTGIYSEVMPNERIAYTMPDDRKVEVDFAPADEGTKIKVTFDLETQNPIEMQREGWQSILDNFKQYCETEG